MITVEKAIEIVKQNCKPLVKEVTKPLEKVATYTLFKNVYSPINMPPFRQAAMDGYALHLHNKLNYKLIGEIKAGDNFHPKLKAGETVRIFTGAPVPDSANAIEMQEKVSIQNDMVTISSQIPIHHNIRPEGEQVKKGELALKKDSQLTPAAIGYLSSLGISEVSVYKKPSIAIVSTGNEIIESNQPLGYGQIYESNSKMLQSALYNLNFYDVSIHKIKDDYIKTYETLKELIYTNDLVLISGGISVGDYDFVGKALKAIEVEELFYKVKQKPGKPLFFGKKEQTIVFALPGNPAAALTCFYVYVYIALQKMMGKISLELPRIQAKSKSVFKKMGDRPQFLKAFYNDDEVTILEGQSSAMLQTFALSNALVFIPENSESIAIDDFVTVMLLPN